MQRRWCDLIQYAKNNTDIWCRGSDIAYFKRVDHRSITLVSDKEITQPNSVNQVKSKGWNNRSLPLQEKFFYIPKAVESFWISECKMFPPLCVNLVVLSIPWSFYVCVSFQKKFQLLDDCVMTEKGSYLDLHLSPFLCERNWCEFKQSVLFCFSWCLYM